MTTKVKGLSARPNSSPPIKPLVLIPAAGFGRRVGSPESKEMLERRPAEPFINRPLDLASERGWPVHVITRQDKTGLVAHLQLLQRMRPSIHIQLIEPTRDWPQTLLASQAYWHRWNIVLLPDVEFYPESILDQMHWHMNSTHDLVWAEHRQKNLRPWGVIERRGERRVVICEKPQGAADGQAWGIFAFRDTCGEALLRAQAQSTIYHTYFELELRGRALSLESFVDLTR